MSTRKNMTRRQVLKALAATPLINFTSRSNAAGGNTDARSLVCIFLAGGADSFNFVVPGGNAFDDYAATRGVLAVPESRLLASNDAAQGEFGFNDALSSLHALYQDQRLAVISNVGNLVRPTTQADFQASISLPESLFAHDAQQKLWQSGSGQVVDSLGWGGGMAEALAGLNTGANVATSMSVAGANTWLTALQAPFVSLSPNATVQRLTGFDSVPAASADVKTSLLALLAQAESGASSGFTTQAAHALRRAVDTAAGLDQALDDHPVSNMTYASTNKLAKQLHQVARLISAREQLGMSRQLFFVRLGGWDTHGSQLGRFVPLLRDLNEAVGSFQDALDNMGKADSVTSFTASDFGRTLTSNGDGTDHGWGGHAMVFGGDVNGGRVVGAFPSFVNVDNPDDALDNSGGFAGRIIPQIAVAQYAATLAQWMGVSDSEQAAMLTNLANFSTPRLGFMNV
ncbi:MAG: DUF1501 domain-containing protein [Gammaproteobacteria bacterium]